MEKKKVFTVWFLLELILAAVLLICLFRLAGIACVVGDSMLPEYHDGQVLIYSKIAKNYDVSDVIIFRHDGRCLIKRIAACPGDVVPGGYVLEDDEFWVLGDNSEVSVDSRAFGAVLASDILGKVL